MRLAILSDIHGNAVALEAVLADLSRDPVDRLVCLGDAIQGGPQPAEVVEHLRRLGCPVVMGNADAWLLTGRETGSEAIAPERRAKMDAAREWSLGRLGPADRELIAGFAPTVTMPLGGGRELLGFHGSPRSFDEILLPETPRADFERALGPFASAFLAGGHVHVQFVRHLGRSFHLNPGSVGVAYRHHQPEDGFQLDPWAEYAVLAVEGERVALEFRRVPFDVAALLRVYRESGRPHAEDVIREYETPA